MAVLATVLACSTVRQEDLSFLFALLRANFSHRVEPHVRLTRGAGFRCASTGLAGAIALNTFVLDKNRNVRCARVEAVVMKEIRMIAFLVARCTGVHCIVTS